MVNRQLGTRNGLVLWIACATLIVGTGFVAAAAPDESSESDWLVRFGNVPPSAAAEGISARRGKLPVFSVTPVRSGLQLVRVSLPFPAGSYPAGLGLVVLGPNGPIDADVRPLTYHPGAPCCIRRAMVTFSYDFPDVVRREFAMCFGPPGSVQKSEGVAQFGFHGRLGKLEIRMDADSIDVVLNDKDRWAARAIAPYWVIWYDWVIAISVACR
jgi:hypothetical protein